MRAVAIDGFGGREAMRIADLPPPVPGPGEVRLRMAFAGVNPADWKLREGRLNVFPGFRPSFPFVLGYDGAGVVESRGAGVSSLAIGDRVAAKADQANARWGAFAELMCTPANLVGRVPDALSLADAAALPVAGITAWHGLFLHGGLKAGQSVFVNAGSGAVGTFAVQFARAAGAEIAASSSPANVDAMRALGADLVVDYCDPGRYARLAKSFPGGLDLVLDAAGDADGALLDLLKPGGIYVRIPSLGPRDEPEPRAAQHGLKIVKGGIVAAEAGKAIAAMAGLLADGRIVLPDIRLRPLDEAADALEDNRTGAFRGKQILAIAGEAA